MFSVSMFSHRTEDVEKHKSPQQASKQWEAAKQEGHEAARQESVRDAGVRPEHPRAVRLGKTPHLLQSQAVQKGGMDVGDSISPKGPPLLRTLLYPCPFVLPTALSYPAASSRSLSCTWFHLPGWCHSGWFCTYLVRQRQARVGIPIRLFKLDNGDESRFGVFILAGVAQGQWVGLQDKSKGRLRSWDSVLQRVAQAHCKLCALRTCPKGVGHPCVGHHHRCYIPWPCLSVSEALNATKSKSLSKFWSTRKMPKRKVEFLPFWCLHSGLTLSQSQIFKARAAHETTALDFWDGASRQRRSQCCKDCQHPPQPQGAGLTACSQLAPCQPLWAM